MESPQELREALAKFGPGTANLWSHAVTPWLSYSDGVKHFAEHAGCGGFWFIDLIGDTVRTLAKHERFLVLRLVVADGRAMLRIADYATDSPQMRAVRVPRTDCPLGEWTFYLVDGVLMLTSEL